MNNIWDIVKSTEFEKPIKAIHRELTEVSFNTWIGSIKNIDRKDNTIIISVENEFTKGILETRFSALLKIAFEMIGIEQVNIVANTKKESIGTYSINNEEKILNLLEKIYSELQNSTNEIQNIKNEVKEIKNKVVIIEQDHGKKLDALFDEHKQTSDKLDRIESEVSKHYEIIIKKVK